MENHLFDINYKKSMGKNYMYFEPTEALLEHTHNTPYTEDFRIKMVKENHINNILHTHIQYVNNTPTFYYDITGLQSLKVILDNISLDYNMLCLLFSGIYNGLISCENYMLKPDHLLLSEEHLFVSADFSRVGLCYFPLNATDFTSSIRSLFDYLLKKVNHRDEQCVYLAYTIHKECHGNDFSMNKLYSYLSSLPTEQIAYEDNLYSEPIKETSSDIDIDEEPSLSDLSITPKQPSLMNRIRSKLSYIFTGQPLEPARLTDLHIASDRHPEESILLNDSSCTVLLSAPENPDFHMLVYTGTDMTSKIKLTHYPFIIGKNNSCDSVLSNPMISRLHARFTCEPGDDDSLEYYIEDLNSTNGTFLNSTPLTPYEKYSITFGDYISFGHLTYIFH